MTAKESPAKGAHEIEVKLRVEDLGAFLRRLKTLGARRLGRVHEMNTLYDTPRGRLRKRGHLLRLRVLTPTDRVVTDKGIVTLGPHALLTFKGPSLPATAGLRLETGDGGGEGAGPRGQRRKTERGGPASPGGRYKVRREVEVPLDDHVPVRAILQGLGLRPSFRYEKFRTTYTVPGHRSVKLELDETPIGTFVEIEGPPRSIDRLAQRLGRSARDYITSSYIGLYLDSCRRRGRAPGNMLFAARWRPPFAGRRQRKA